MNILAETASPNLSKEPHMVPDRSTPVISLVTELPIITTHFPPAGNIVSFEQKSTVQSQAITDRLVTDSPTPTGSTKKPWDLEDYLPSALGPLEKPDISEITEEVPQSTTVISQHATDSWDGITEDKQTHESFTHIEQIEVGPLVTAMEISKHIPSKELPVTKTPFSSTEMTLEPQTEMKTESTIPELVTTSHHEFTMREDASEERTLTVRSGQSTLVFSQMPEIITVSKTLEDTTYSQIRDLESTSTSTIAPPTTMLDKNGSPTDKEEEKQTNGKITEDFLGQSLPTTPFLLQHLTEVELFPYSGDKISVEGISTIIYPSLQTEKTQGNERPETPRPELETDTYTDDETQEKITTKESFVGTTEEDGFSGMKFSTSSSEQIHFTESSVEMTKSFISPALPTVKLSVEPTEARDLEEKATRTVVTSETDDYQHITEYDQDATASHLTHSTLDVEVVTVSKWPWDEDNATSKPLSTSDQTGSPKLPPISLSTVGTYEKDKEIPSFTEDIGDEFTLFPDSTQEPFSEEDLTSEKFTVKFYPTTSIGIAEKSTLRDSTTEGRVQPTTSTESQVIHVTVEGSALGEEDTDDSRPLFTVSPFAHTSDVELFVNDSSTQEPTTYVATSHIIPLSVIPRIEWGVVESSVPSEDEVLGVPDQDSHVIEQTHLETTMSPETFPVTEITQGTTQEELSWKEQTTVKSFTIPSSTVVVTKVTRAFSEDEGEGSASTISEDRLVTGSERGPLLETTPVGKIEHDISYPPGAVTEHKAEMDKMITLTPSIILSQEPELKQEAEGSSQTDFASTLRPFGTQLTEETTMEEREKTSLDYTGLGSGFFEKPIVTDLPEFLTIKTTVLSDISAPFTSTDSLHRTPPIKPSSLFTEEPPVFDQEPSEKTTHDLVLTSESTPHPPTLTDTITKAAAATIDIEYHTPSKTPATYPPILTTVESKETFKPQAFSTPPPPAGTKFHPDINVYIIEVRENKTGKSLFSRQSTFLS